MDLISGVMAMLVLVMVVIVLERCLRSSAVIAVLEQTKCHEAICRVKERNCCWKDEGGKRHLNLPKELGTTQRHGRRTRSRRWRGEDVSASTATID